MAAYHAFARTTTRHRTKTPPRSAAAAGPRQHNTRQRNGRIDRYCQAAPPFSPASLAPASSPVAVAKTNRPAGAAPSSGHNTIHTGRLPVCQQQPRKESPPTRPDFQLAFHQHNTSKTQIQSIATASCRNTQCQVPAQHSIYYKNKLLLLPYVALIS